MIKITSIEIDGFIVPSQKVKLDFVESNIICIYGDNGSGKTTFLEILFAVFDRNEEILEQFNVNSIKILYKNNNLEVQNNIKIDIDNLIYDKSIYEKRVENEKLKLLKKQKNEKSLLMNQLNKLKAEISSNISKSKEKLESILEVEKSKLIQEEKNIKEEIHEQFEKFKLGKEYQNINKKSEKELEHKNNISKIEDKYKEKIKSLEQEYEEKTSLLENKKIVKFSLLEKEFTKKIDSLLFLYEQELKKINHNLKDIENKIKIKQDILKEISQIYSISIIKIEETYDWDKFDKSEFNNISSLFLGIGRGIHKKELDIPRQTLWHFFRSHKKISEDKILTGNEIDDFTDKLVKHLDNANLIEIDKAKELDDKTNIYLPHIEIDTLEAFLMSKYKEVVVDAREKIEKALFKTSINSFKIAFQSINIDLEELRKKLIYNQSLLLEMFAKDEDMGIETVFNSLEENEEFLVDIDSYKQVILSAIINELQSEVELFKEIQVFLDEYNSFLNYDKNLVLSSNGVFVTPENHSIQKLSSGERHLLTFLATILLMGEEQDFILLDEPEISLDIEWQEKLLSTISKLAPNSQIIVASHSPSIMGDYFDESIEITMCEE